MDGGGRLAGSLRQPGAKSVLSQLAGLFRRKQPAPRVRRLNDNRLIARLEDKLPRNFGTVATLLILLGSLAVGVVRGGHLETITEAFRDARDAVAKTAGFRIAHVAIAGRKHLSQDEILAIGGVTGRRSLLFLDPATVRDQLKAAPWIADATVLKFYPDSIQIDIVERTPFALWQHDGSVSVISAKGIVLQPYTPGEFKSLPLVVGRGADTRAKEFLDLLGQHPHIRQQVKAIIYVGERRWNLRLADGIDVRLPEKDVDAALAALTKLDKDENLFSRDITAIDLRLPDRLTVRLSEDAAKARADMLKDKDKARARKKANEA
jgi:cell division protein FtsQ